MQRREDLKETDDGQIGTKGSNTAAACNIESNNYLRVIKYHKNDKDNVGDRKQNNKTSMTATVGKAKVNQAYVKYETGIDGCHVSESEVAYSNYKNVAKATKPFTGIKDDSVETSNSVDDDYVPYDPDERHGSGGTRQLTARDGEGYGNDADYENIAGVGITKDTEIPKPKSRNKTSEVNTPLCTTALRIAVDKKTAENESFHEPDSDYENSNNTKDEVFGDSDYGNSNSTNDEMFGDSDYENSNNTKDEVFGDSDYENSNNTNTKDEMFGDSDYENSNNTKDERCGGSDCENSNNTKDEMYGDYDYIDTEFEYYKKNCPIKRNALSEESNDKNATCSNKDENLDVTDTENENTSDRVKYKTENLAKVDTKPLDMDRRLRNNANETLFGNKDLRYDKRMKNTDVTKTVSVDSKDECININSDIHVYVVEMVQCPPQVGILSGTFLLDIAQTGLKLMDIKTKKKHLFWPYNGIRRFGLNKERKRFLFEAGRRCEKGPGIYVFQANNPEKIYEETLKMSKKSTSY